VILVRVQQFYDIEHRTHFVRQKNRELLDHRAVAA